MWYKKIRQNSWILLTVLCTAGPILLGIGYALAYSLGLTGLLNEGFTLGHWLTTLSYAAFWKSLLFSFAIAILTVVIACGLALFIALKWREAWNRSQFLLYLPLTIPAIVMAFFVFQFLSKSGFLSRVCNRIGLTQSIEGFPDLVNDNYGIGILFAHLCMATPFFAILFLQVFRNERIQAFMHLSFTLGSTQKNTFRKVVLPMIVRKSLPAIILYFIFSFGSYEIPLLLGSQSPQMISVFTLQKLQRFNLADIPIAYVSSIVYTLFIVLVLIVINRLLNYPKIKGPTHG
jgi:putative spermidine/putrescine transport system permease protein